MTHCTPESIAAAKDARDRERDAIYAQSGLRVTDDGAIVIPPRAFIVLCPKVGCVHAASARTEARAIRSISAHLVRAHRVEAS